MCLKNATHTDMEKQRLNRKMRFLKNYRIKNRLRTFQLENGQKFENSKSQSKFTVVDLIGIKISNTKLSATIEHYNGLSKPVVQYLVKYLSEITKTSTKCEIG